MAEITLVAEVGRAVGTGPARRLRHEGRVPAIVYGHGITPLAVTVVGRELRAALSGDAGVNTVISLAVSGKRHMALARDIQRHPVRGTVLHVDFLVVDPRETVTADVPIGLVGDAVELHRADGIVDQQLFTLPVKAKPADIPPHLEVDISNLLLGAAIRVADLTLPDGVTTDLDPDALIVLGLPPRVAREEGIEGEAAEEADRTAEGEPSEARAASESGGGGSGAATAADAER
jgi:large subunit ribosomal protein L25